MLDFGLVVGLVPQCVGLGGLTGGYVQTPCARLDQSCLTTSETDKKSQLSKPGNPKHQTLSNRHTKPALLCS